MVEIVGLCIGSYEFLSRKNTFGDLLSIFSQDDLNIEDVIIYHYGIKNTLNDGYFSLPYLNKVLCEFLYKE